VRPLFVLPLCTLVLGIRAADAAVPLRHAHPHQLEQLLLQPAAADRVLERCAELVGQSLPVVEAHRSRALLFLLPIFLLLTSPTTSHRERLRPLPGELLLAESGEDEQERDAHHHEGGRVRPECLHLHLSSVRDPTGRIYKWQRSQR
jgi:hypothetical protein